MATEITEGIGPATTEELIKKRNRPGRSSRRRKAKMRAVHEAEERLWNVSAITPSMDEGDKSRFVGGGDRDRIWPGVLERRSEMWLDADEINLVGQLGYLPGNAVAVSARSSLVPQLGIVGDVPIVLQLYPIAMRDAYAGGKSDGRKFKGRKRCPSKRPESPDDEVDLEERVLIEPFPTMYWLTHPLLRTLTSKLEIGDTHSVKILEERLSTDDYALELMKEAHKAYGEARWKLLTSDDQAQMELRRWKESLAEDVGVAGIRKPFAIKCLHTHLAHHLSGGPGSDKNVVGKWVLEELCRMVNTRTQSTQAYSP
ncbi:Protein of unknown function (DUF501) [Fragilaria crotonensis]|nr:Protein of unknown function (DUF501) [Fragilaria crotonensis]